MALEAQNNPFTSVLMVEAADPEALPDADPAAGQRRLAVGTDHLLYLVDNSGVKTLVGGAGIANPLATDSLWDAAGDLVQGSGANTAAKLSAGTAGKVLTSNGAAAALTWETPSASADVAVGARVKRSAVQSIANNTLSGSTAIGWDQEDYDTDTFHDTSTNNSRLTVPTGKAGKYLIEAIVKFANNTSGTQRYADIWLNATTVIASTNGPFNTSVNVAWGICATWNASVGDYFEIRVYQDSGGALDFQNTSGVHASISRLGT
jgi:hypothetical protein